MSACAYLVGSEAVAVRGDAVHDCDVVVWYVREGDKSAGLEDTVDLSVAGSGLRLVNHSRLRLATECV